MGIIPSLSEITDQAPVEAGEYDLRITKMKETKTINSGRFWCMLIIENDG